MYLDSDTKFEIRAMCSDKLMALSDDEIIALAKEYVEDYEETYYAYDALMDELAPEDLAMTLNVDVSGICADMEQRAEESRRINRQIENEYLRNAI